MTDSTDNALKPCPFCGGVGHMAKDPDMNWGDFYSIKCGACRAKSPEFHASETCPIFFAQVRDAWNRRADLAPTPQDDARVKALVAAAILDAQLRAFEQRRLDTPDEIKAAALAAFDTTGGKADG